MNCLKQIINTNHSNIMTLKYKFSIALIFAVCLFQSSVLGQNKYLELIKQKNYSKAEKTIANELWDKNDDVALNYAMAVLLIQPKYKKFNTEKSYRYLTKSEKLYDKIKDERLLKNLNKIPINAAVFDNFTDSICRMALDEALKINTIAKYSKYLDNFKTAPETYRQKAIIIRDSLAYQLVIAANTLESYQSFVDKYSKSAQYLMALDRRDSMAFKNAQLADSIVAYKNYLKNYPQSKQINIVKSRLYELAYHEAQKVNTSESYRKFSEDYPLSPKYAEAYSVFEKKQFFENVKPNSNWLDYKSFCEKFPNNSFRKIALDTINSYAIQSKNLDALQFVVDNSIGVKREHLLLILHQLFTDDGEKMTLDLFYKKYNDEVLSECKAKDYHLVEMSKKLMLHQPYNPKDAIKYDAYIRSAAPLEKAYVALQKMISIDLEKKNWKNAIHTVKLYLPYFGKLNKKVLDLIRLLEKNVDKSVKIYSVGDLLNTIDGGEYTPVISADDKLLYFCGRDRIDNIGGEDIFVSQRKNGVWQAAEIIKELSLKKTNDAPLNISADGTSMLLFKSGKILHSDKSETGWTAAIAFPPNINAGSWQADAMISSNGKALLFASTKKGGYNLFSENSTTETYHGGNQYFSDIYVSLLDKSNKWSDPINLGDVINTRFCDRMPFLHPDMKTLYFSSDGHGGLGELDVFKSTRLADSCWNCWSEPVNLGKEINTASSDWGYKISTYGQTAYFAKIIDTRKNFDIYTLNLPKELQPNSVQTISGKIVDNNNQPISVEIRWTDVETGVEIGQSKSDPKDGNFFIVLPVGKHYRYTIDKPKFVPVTTDVDLRNDKKSIHIDKSIKLISYKDFFAVGKLLPFNNIIFNTASFELLETAKIELKQAAKMIISNHLSIEIMGHTDIVGDENKNQTLSMERSNAVRDFLIKEGCLPKKLLINGYGKTKPIATNIFESGRAKNRRVELKIVSNL